MMYAREMPDRLIPQSSVHDWARYETGLVRSPLTASYLGDILRKWVQSTPCNPLQVPWLAGLVEFDDAGIEPFLQRFEKEIGQSSLRDLIQDLFREPCSSQASRQIQSFYAEYVAAEYLQKTYGGVTKAREYVDLEVDGFGVSVKAVLGADFNYELLRNLLLGLLLVKENKILRDFGRIVLRDLAGANYAFLKYICAFMETDLMPLLERAAALMSVAATYPTVTEVRPLPSSDVNKQREIELSHRGDDGAITVQLALLKTTEVPTRTLSMVFERSTDGMIEVSTELDSSNSFAMSGSSELALANKIDEKIGKMCLARTHYQRSFKGWLDLAIHPLHERYVSGSIDFNKRLVKAVGATGFPVYLCVRGGFALAPQRIVEIGVTS
jgi:hypothetical protein